MLDEIEDITRSHRVTPAVLAAALSACATETVLLNSERVERQFGSYGIDVLASEAGLRRSSLFSFDNQSKICRTYAVVQFTEKPDSSFRPEHAKVLAGNSLGEIFKSHGWSIHKQTIHIGSFEISEAGAQIRSLMRLGEEATLSLHVYQLLLVRDEEVFEYATIIETHHPQYLSETDLLKIYPYDNSVSLSAPSLRDLVSLLLSGSG